MKELFDKEEQVCERSRNFLRALGESAPPQYQEEYAFLAAEYAQLLRHLRRVTRLSDLTAQGLNADKEVLLNKINVDALTEIYNRRYLMASLPNILDDLAKSRQWISVLMLDVDYFKRFNDTYGHPAGDICLRNVAKTVEKSLSAEGDFVVRYGGEEFLVVLPAADKEMGACTAQIILQNIWNMNIPHEASKVADRITLSIGIVSAIPAAEAKMQQYIDRADAALYIAKKSGRNQTVYLSLERGHAYSPEE